MACKLIIKLRRKKIGVKPIYDIVVGFNHQRSHSDFIECIGQFDPSSNIQTGNINRARLAVWMARGASITTPV